MTTQPYPNVDVTVPGLKQGVDMVLPLLLEPDDPNAPPLTADTKVVFEANERKFSRSGRESRDKAFTLSTDLKSAVVYPETQSIDLQFSRNLTLGLGPSRDMTPFQIYGTVYVFDAAGRSYYGQDFYLPIEASFFNANSSAPPAESEEFLALPPVVLRPTGPYVVVSEGAPQTPSKLESDATPKLGGDLDLNAHQITGTLSSPLLIIDGGLD